MEIKAIDANITIQILNRLLGETTPYGCSSRDEVRIWNLDNALIVADWLLDKIEEAAKFHDRPEASIRAIGNRAYGWLEDVGESFSTAYSMQLEEVNE